MENCTIRINTLLLLLSCMESLQNLTLEKVEIEELISDMSIVYKSPTILYIRESAISADTLQAMLSCMTQLQKLELNDIEIVDLKLNMSVVCKSPTIFHMTYGAISANTVLAMLSCMIQLQELKLSVVSIEELKSDMSVTLTSLIHVELSLLSMHHEDEIGANTLLTILSVMPSLQKLTLDQIEIIGELNLHKPVVWESLLQFDMVSCAIRASALQAMLSGLPSRAKVSLEYVEMEGVILVTYNSLTNLTMQSCDYFCSVRITGQTLITVLRCMSLSKVLRLYDLDIGNLDSHMSVLWETLTKFAMKNCTIGENTLLAMLTSLPSLAEVTFERVRMVGETGVILLTFTALTNLVIKGLYGHTRIKCQILSAVLRCMPLLKVMKLDGLEIEELDSDTLVVLKSLTEFKIRRSSIRANTLLAMLGGMPSLQVLKLSCIGVGELDSDMQVVRVGISTNKLLEKLSGMPSLQELRLAGLD